MIPMQELRALAMLCFLAYVVAGWLGVAIMLASAWLDRWLEG